MTNETICSARFLVPLSKSNGLKNHDNSLEAQRSRVLQHLRTGRSLTTLEARELGIMHPAGRIMELRKRGYSIITYWTIVEAARSKHRIGKYFLSNQKQEGGDCV